MGLNGSIFDAINGLAGNNRALDDVMKFSAQYLVYAIAALVVVSWFVRGVSREEARLGVYTAVLAAVVALVIAKLIQHYYVHQRPFVTRTDVTLLVDHARDASFPSEHTTGAFALAAGLGFYRRAWGLLLIALACLMAFARVFVGIHWPADVASGAAIGIAVAAVLWFARPVLEWLDRGVLMRCVPAPLRRYV